MNFASPNGGQRVPCLDGLRGIAILLVLTHHFVVPLLGNIPASAGSYVAAALTLSYSGVDLFFVLSGYLIGGIIFEQRDSPRFNLTFYVRRTARILPLALAGILATIWFHQHGRGGPTEGGPAWSVAVYLVFAVNFFIAGAGDWGFRPLSHYWSLAIEEQFYLAVPALVRGLPRTRTLTLILALIALAPLVRLAILATGGTALAASVLPVGRTDGLGLGMLVAWIMRSPKARDWCRQRSALLHGTAVVAILGCMVLTKFRADNGGFIMAAGGYTVVAVLYSVFLLQLVGSPDSLFARLLTLKPLVRFGQWSYFLYLFQGLGIGFAVSFIFYHRVGIVVPTSWSQLAVGLTFLVTLAAMSYRWIEAPILSWARRFSY